MAKFRDDKTGFVFEIDVPEGPAVTPEQPLSIAAAPVTPGLPILDDPSPVSSSIDEVNKRRRRAAELAGRRRTTGESFQRGLGLAGRVIPSAIMKFPANIADLGASILNVIPAAISAGDVALGGKPLDARLPTSATQSVDEFLNQIFPEPEGFLEKLVSGAGDIALTGGAAGAALAPKVVSRVGEGIPTLSKAVPGLLEEIGISASISPKVFATLESTGAAGSQAAGQLAEEAGATPGQTITATTLAGLASILAPQVALNQGRRLATGVASALDKLTKGEVSAARLLQEATPDPQAAAKAAREAPEGVLPARATDEPRLRALEERVIADDPILEAKVRADLEAVEKRSLTELADEFGPTSDKADFQRTVIERGAAPGTKIEAGQPDEMLKQAANSFDGAYKAAEGFEIRTQDFSEKNVVALKTQLANATGDTRVIANKKTREGIAAFLDGLLTDVSRRGPSVGPADVPIAKLQSEDLLEMRRIVRQEVRDRSKPTAGTKAKAERRLLQNGADAITRTLESQLPADASAALRATDIRYKDFITVQSAVLKSGEKGLTPEALRASVKARAPSEGQFARGEIGDLGRLAEQGKDITTTLARGRTSGKPDQAARIVRDMTPEQVQVVKADLADGMANNATSPTTQVLSGKNLLTQLESNREVLKAAGYTDADFKRIETIAKQLKVAQSRSPTAATKLLENDVGRVLNLLARVAGSKTAQKITKFIGGTAGLIIPQFTSKVMQQTLEGLSVNNAANLIRKALRGDKVVIDGVTQKQTLFDALMTKPTDGLKRQAEAARTIKAFLLQAPGETEEEE